MMNWNLDPKYILSFSIKLFSQVFVHSDPPKKSNTRSSLFWIGRKL
jgi:hypothetical protein